MGRKKNEKAEQARDLYLTGWKLVDIARELDVPEGTVRRWKSTYGWETGGDANARKKANVRNDAAEELVEAVIDAPELTDKQRLFVLYYARSFNATRAYQKAFGCSYATALTEGPATLGNPRIRDEIMRVKKERCAKALLTGEDLFEKYLEIAYADITDYLEFGREEVPVMGPFGPIKVEDPDTGEKVPLTQMVNTVRARESGEVDGTILTEVSQGKNGFKVKMADRMKAMQWLSDHMGMATEEQKARIEKLRAEAAKARDPAAEDPDHENNLLEAIKGAGEVSTDDLPEAE